MVRGNADFKSSLILFAGLKAWEMDFRATGLHVIPRSLTEAGLIKT